MRGGIWQTLLIEAQLDGEVKDWFLSEVYAELKSARDLDEALLNGYACAAKRESLDVKQELAGERFTTFFDRRQGQFLDTLSFFEKYPSAQALNRRWFVSLASEYDGLRLQEAHDKVFEISDRLLALKPHLKFENKDAQYALTYPLVALVRQKSDRYHEYIAPWLEDADLEDPRFTFNLACYFAQKHERETLYSIVERAVALGKPAQEFKEDSDFASFLDDDRFLKAIGE